MLIDGGVLVGYLTAYLLKGARKAADRTLDALLEDLVQRITRRLGRRPLEDLARAPRDADNQEAVARGLEDVISRDKRFAHDVATKMNELDRHGGWNFVQMVYSGDPRAYGGSVVQGSVTVDRGGKFVGGSNMEIYAPVRLPGDLSDSSIVIRALVALGGLVCLAGLGIFGHALFTYDPLPGETGPPDGVVNAAIVFFSGLVIMALGGLVNFVFPPRQR